MVNTCTFKFYKAILATLFIIALTLNVVSLTVKIFLSTVKEQLEFDTKKVNQLIDEKKQEITHHSIAFLLYYIGFLICILESYRWIITYVLAQATILFWFCIVHSNNMYTVHVSSCALTYSIFAFLILPSEIMDSGSSVTFLASIGENKWKNFIRNNKRLIYLTVTFILMIISSTFTTLFIVQIHEKDLKELTLATFQHSLETDVKRAFFVLPLIIVISLLTIPMTSCAAKIHRIFYPMQIISSLLFFLIGANSAYFEFIGAISILTFISAFFARFVQSTYTSSVTLKKVRATETLSHNYEYFPKLEGSKADDSLLKSTV